MADQIKPPIGQPLGFPQCPKCLYLRSGPPPVCLACARKSFDNVTATACPVCSQIMESGSCPNWLCTDSARRITRIRAIAYSSGELRTTIHRYKYRGKQGWSLIFGRLLVAWLDQNGRENPPDLIIANPTFVGDDGAKFGHTERVIETAAAEDVLGEWSFDTRALMKKRSTSPSAGGNVAAKRAAATELRDVLYASATAKSKIHNKRILVYDDVCTTGNQLNTVAEYLIDECGAANVEGIVLARAPWRFQR